MTSRDQDNDSQNGQSSSSGFPLRPEFEDMTRATSDESLVFAFKDVSNLVKEAREIIPQIKIQVVAEQLNKLLLSIRMMFEIEQRKRPNLNLSDIPPLTAQVEEDGAILLQWKFPDFRVGFNIEPDPNKSGWHLVSNEKLDEITASGRLSNTNETVQTLLQFILPNI